MGSSRLPTSKTVEISNRYTCPITILDHLESVLTYECKASKLPHAKRFLVTLTVEEIEED